MKVEAIIKKRTAEIELISKQDNSYKIRVDDKQYDFDIITTGKGSFSILCGNNSWDIEALRAKEFNTFTVYKNEHNFKVEIVDEHSKYRKNKGGAGMESDQKHIIAPMPGKIVKVLVEEGQVVKVGDTILIISAMKMESEFKSSIDGVIKKVHVKENNIVNGNQLLVEIE